MEFRPIVIGLLLFGLIATAFITGAIQLAYVNQADQSIGDYPILSKYASDLNESLAEASSSTSSTEEALAESPITLSTSSVFLDAMGGIWKTLKSIPTTVYNLTAGLITAVIFGGSAFAIALAIIGSILTITIVLSVWKLIRTGEGG